MKKLKMFCLTIFSLLLFPCIVNAASGSIKVTGSSTAVVGNRVTYTVTLSSSTAIGSWQMDLNYDKSYLQLVSSTAESNGTMMTNSSSGTKSKSYTFTFKALKTGTTRLSVSSYLVYDYTSMNEMNITASSNTVKIITQEELEASYSKDNNLKSLSVEGFSLDKEFNKDTLDYTVDVPTGTTKVKVEAKVNDNTASLEGTGEIEVTEGLNTIPIIVTAQNGDQKTYTLIVNVEDQNPIKVELNDKEYIVVKNNTLLEAPLTFTETTVTINDYEIPAFINNVADITLVGLKDNYGNIILVQYKNNNYYSYNELNLNTYMLIPDTFDTPLDLIKTSVTINDEKIDAYKYSENSSYVIISAKSLNDGRKALYLYDPINKTAMKYDSTYLDEANKTITNYTYVIIVFASALGLMLIIILALILSLHKKQKKIKKFIAKQEAKIEATRKLNDVVEEVQNITKKEHHQIKQDTTALPKVSKNNKDSKNNKENNDTVQISKINIDEKKAKLEKNKDNSSNQKEELSKTKKIPELKEDTPKTNNDTKTSIKELPQKNNQQEQEELTKTKITNKNLEETEIYRIFDDDFKVRRKKKK